jgi:hypothetical protein
MEETRKHQVPGAARAFDKTTLAVFYGSTRPLQKCRSATGDAFVN